MVKTKSTFPYLAAMNRSPASPSTQRITSHRPQLHAAPRRTLMSSTGQSLVSKKGAAHSLFAQQDVQRVNSLNKAQMTARGMRIPSERNIGVSRAQQSLSGFPTPAKQTRISSGGKDLSRLNVAKQTQRPSVLAGQNAMRKRGGDMLARPNTKLTKRS